MAAMGLGFLAQGRSKARRSPATVSDEPPPQIVHRPRRVEKQSDGRDPGGARLGGRCHGVQRDATDGQDGHPDGLRDARQRVQAGRPVAARLRAGREDGAEDQVVGALRFGGARFRPRECTERPTRNAAGTWRRTSAVGIESDLRWTPSASAASATSTRSLTMMRAPRARAVVREPRPHVAHERAQLGGGQIRFTNLQQVDAGLAGQGQPLGERAERRRIGERRQAMGAGGGCDP